MSSCTKKVKVTPQNSKFVNRLQKLHLFLHVISGCDTTSNSREALELQAELFNCNEYLQNIPKIFNNNPKSTYDDIEQTGERFIIILYNNMKKTA
ncbi:hypothetical protein AVEN_97500-1 [Araneus ventricosus]|uniref:Uncharacterized protein n=1 Tax=Araneus ventricosus TaxID=182803 RepID=A0A4Y2AL70_ARAVE|nr:hypothetical protein AVEN_97500-1 [Araneus ventricosus]